MKKTITIFTFFTVFLCNAQGKENVVYEKWYHPNGKIQIECDYDTLLNCYAGIYKEFDTTGFLMIEGEYKIVDSVQCIDCYDGSPSRYEIKSQWIKYEYEDLRNVPIGEWKYYHPNGQIKMKGMYSEKVHSFRGEVYRPDEKSLKEMQDAGYFDLTETGPINIWISNDLLKNGIWIYYDENGKKNKIEEYIDGALIYVNE